MVAMTVLPVVQATQASAASSPPFIEPSAGWLDSVNYFRSMAHLAPVVENPALDPGAQNHSCYMLQNGLTHYEVSGKPGYTVDGERAGRNSNVTVSSDIRTTQRTHVELWMGAPFHAIGVLRPGLQSVGFGLCTDPATPNWHSGASLDIIGGLDYSIKTQEPILFPGDGTTTNLTTLSPETPDPLGFCGWTGQGGLPVIAMMPEKFTGTPVATISTKSGPLESCVLSGNNTPDVAGEIMRGDNAIVVVPRNKLSPDTYTVTVSTSARTVSWSFTVDPAASAPVVAAPTTQALSGGSSLLSLDPSRIADTRSRIGATRLAAGRLQRIQVTGKAGVPAGAQAVSANFTAVGAAANGYLTVWNCGGPMPTVSTLNY
jgi:hypothetical protein